MKKIIIITLSLFVLASCGEAKTWTIKSNNNSVKKTEITTDKKVEKQEKTENIETGKIEEKKVGFEDIKNNLNKLEKIWIKQEDLRFINEELVSVYNRKIEENAIKNNDINICNKSDKNNVENCKKQVIIKSEKIESCDSLTDKYSKIDCKNTILKAQANTKLDESICDKLVFDEPKKVETEEKSFYIDEKNREINECKNNVLTQKAMKNLDSNICKKISNKNEISSCEEYVKMEKDNTIKEEEINKTEK